MSRVTQDPSVDRSDDPAQQVKFTSLVLEEVANLLNNGLTFTDNFDAKFLSVTFSAAATNQAIAHGLGRAPSGYVILRKSANVSVWDGTNNFSATYLYLAADAAGTITVMVY